MERAAKKSRFGVRSILAVVCLVVATLLLPVGIVGFWGQRTLTDTERFVATVGPLVNQPEVVDTVATAVSNAITNSAGLETAVKDLLPPRAESLAGPITTSIAMFAKEATVRLMNTEQFKQLWIQTITKLQQGVIKALEGDNSGPVQLQNDEIVLDLGQIIDVVKQDLINRGLTALSSVPTPPAADRQIVLLNAEQLAQAQFIYSFSVPIASWLIVFVLLLFVAAFVLARRKARMAVWIGVCVLLVAGTLRIVLSAAPNVITNTFIGTPLEESAAVFFTTLTSFLLASVSICVLIGIVLVVAGWIFSNQRYAVALRRRFAPPPAVPPAPGAP